MFGSNTFSFETPNVIDVGDLPPTPPTRSSLTNETSNGTGTTTSLSSSSSSNATMMGTAVDVVIEEGTHQNNINEEDSVHFHHLARASATRLLNDIRDLELQSQQLGPHHDQLPLPRSTIYSNNSDSDPTTTTRTTKIPLSQRLPFRDFPSGRRNIKKSPNEMYDPYMDDDEEEEEHEGMKDVMIPYSDHDQHSLPTSGEGLRTNNHHRNHNRQNNNHPYHQNRMGRTMKLSAPSKKNLTTHQPALPRSLFHRSNQNNMNSEEEDDIQNLYDPNHPKGNHSRYQYLCALLEEMMYYMKFYRYRILCVLLMAILVIVITMTVTSSHHNNNHSAELPNFAGTDRYDQIVQYLTQQKQVTSYNDIISTNDSTDADQRTPQNMALNWVVGVDALQYDITNPHLIQRYVLAVLFFATGGQLVPTTTSTGSDTTPSSSSSVSTWTMTFNFMNGNVDECQWSSIVAIPTFTNQMVNMGVSCNSNKDVTTLFIPNNHLQGSLPSELGFLSALTLVGLQDNDIYGTLPVTLQNINTILYFNMNQNQLTGTIPDYIGNWNQLEVIGLEQNNMTGTLPPSFGTASRLVTIALGTNQFTGNLEDLRHLADIKYLYVSHNQFTGTIEQSFFYNMKKIREIDLSHNSFHGQFPTQMLLRGSNLHTIDVAYNNFTGTFPHEVTYPNYVLHYLNLRHNQISGTIAETINKLSALKHLDVTDNRIVGSIPHAIGKCESLEYLFLGNNAYTQMDDSDDIPPLSALDELRELSFTGLNMTGSIPSWLHFLTKLEMLDMSYNHLVGTIPSKVWSLPRLYYLILNDNINITGPLPTSGGTQLSLLSLHHTSVHDENFDNAVCKDNKYNQMTVETGGKGIIVYADCHSGCTSDCCNDCCDDDEVNCGAGVIASYTDGIDHVADAFAFDPSVLIEAQVFDEVDEQIENP